MRTIELEGKTYTVKSYWGASKKIINKYYHKEEHLKIQY